MKRAIRTLAAAIAAAARVIQVEYRRYPPAMQAGEPVYVYESGDETPVEYRLAEAELRWLWGDR